MNQRTEANIGESNKTSVKVHHQPGGASNWSLGWEEPQQKPSSRSIFMLVQKYHNQSNVVFGGDNEAMDEEEKNRKEEERKKKEEEINKNLPEYDPKMGNKTSVHFGDEKPDYRRKD